MQKVGHSIISVNGGKIVPKFATEDEEDWEIEHGDDCVEFVMQGEEVWETQCGEDCAEFATGGMADSKLKYFLKLGEHFIEFSAEDPASDCFVEYWEDRSVFLREYPAFDCCREWGEH